VVAKALHCEAVMTRSTSSLVSRFALTLACTAALAAAPSVQTRIALDKNKYAPADDVKLGREAAAQVRKEMPLIHDGAVDEWVQSVGRRLVTGIPPEFQHKEFSYTFEVVNQKEINAFALPGGPMFLNRGMIEAAKSEGEVAGVMAHEISHVALRHGTAQATKGQKFQLGAILGQVAGAVVGGTAGAIIAQGSQFGLGTYFLKYSREYESQADLLGTQILARAGYDPRQMANMFKTIEAQGGGRQPEWMSSHPNPGNRYDAINREAATLRVQVRPDTGEFQNARGRLTSMSPAPPPRRSPRTGQRRRGPLRLPHARRARGAAVREPAHVSAGRLPARHRARELEPDQHRRGRRDLRARGRLRGVERPQRLHARRAVRRGAGRQRQSPARHRPAAAELRAQQPNLRSRGSRRDSLGGRSGLTTCSRTRRT
jgi:predicted Zn-dependent protease